MKIKKMISQHRRDFIALMECEHCGNEERNNSGYDDDFYHNTVIPDMECKKCGLKSGQDYEPRSTKYPAGMVV
ncbi:MAG: hypothetical protein COB23_03040 [Methylophaga sp.]|nr:MAG: hypothetical protein COB23_03040 [Methylophaga sp.]